MADLYMQTPTEYNEYITSILVAAWDGITRYIYCHIKRGKTDSITRNK